MLVGASGTFGSPGFLVVFLGEDLVGEMLQVVVSSMDLVHGQNWIRVERQLSLFRHLRNKEDNEKEKGIVFLRLSSPSSPSPREGERKRRKERRALS